MPAEGSRNFHTPKRKPLELSALLRPKSTFSVVEESEGLFGVRFLAPKVGSSSATPIIYMSKS